MPVITVNDLCAYYENREIFRELSFRVNEGDYLCVVGENGSGKTTLMRCILGFNVKHTGSVILDGISRCEIGWLPQRTEAQKDFPASAGEVVMSGTAASMWSGKSRAQLRRSVQENMELLEIADLSRRPFRELSGGQQQKVLLCRALCAANKVLLLDEPITGLDMAARDEFYKIIARLNSMGMTVIMITHDLPRAADEAGYILHLAEHGSFYGTSQDYKTSPFWGMGGNI